MKTAKRPKPKKNLATRIFPSPVPYAGTGAGDLQPKVGDMRVWHIPQVPMNPAFYVPIIAPTENLRIATAKLVLDILWTYDAYQFANNIKPDYSNASGLEIFVADGGEGFPDWNEWESEEGESISDLMRHVQ